jgi:hypothetical protein
MRRIPRALFGGVVGVAIGVLILGANANPGMLGLGGANSSGADLTAAECAAIDSNATLTQGVFYLYQGDGNVSGSGSGLINQGPPGFSAYPSESVADSNVINGWLSICESSAFYGLVQAHGPQNNTWDGLDQNASGVYEDVFTVTWNAPASACTPNPVPNGDCIGTEGWLINVASGAVTGPRASFWVPQTPGGDFNGTEPAL